MRILQEALTFDDVLLVPAHSTVLPADANLKTPLTRDLSLNIPLLSAAMDTVTEARLAIALAQEGGMGIIHKNMSIAAQADHVSAPVPDAGCVRAIGADVDRCADGRSRERRAAVRHRRRRGRRSS